MFERDEEFDLHRFEDDGGPIQSPEETDEEVDLI